MSILSDAALTQARTVLETALPDTCNILEVTIGSDGQGGQTETWGTATGGTAVACRLDAVPGLTGRESGAGAAVQPFQSYYLTVPYDTTITGSNRVEHGSYTYAIISVDLDKSWPIDVRCHLERE